MEGGEAKEKRNFRWNSERINGREDGENVETESELKRKVASELARNIERMLKMLTLMRPFLV